MKPLSSLIINSQLSGQCRADFILLLYAQIFFVLIERRVYILILLDNYLSMNIHYFFL
jgi:hypothetical protein